ncbi:MAG: LicD family protein [Anaerovoracaceae bacterium]
MTNNQKYLFMLLKEIHDICQRHDIIYYLAGGTLIGAMRHKGFIPWDDDMDIFMSRDNWHKFIEATKTDMPENRVLECQELNRNYTNMIGRYTDTKSTAIHKNLIFGDVTAGYIIDIFIFDPIPDDGPTYEKYTKDLMLYSDLINPFLNYSNRCNMNEDRFNKYYGRMKREGKEAVLSELESQMFSYPEEDCNYYVMRWGGSTFLFEKNVFGSSRRAMFEGLPCMIPDKPNAYLTWQYGDNWMYIPPHEEHETHDAIFSFTTDYVTMQEDYSPYLDKTKTEKLLLKRKKHLLKNMKKNLRLKDNMLLAITQAKKMEVEEKIKTLGKDIGEMLKAEQYEELSELFSSYYSLQSARNIIGRKDYPGYYRYRNPGLVDLDDFVIYVGLMTLIHTNRMDMAGNFIRVIELVKGDLSPDQKKAKALLLEIREAVNEYDIGKKGEAYEKVKTLIKIYPNNTSLMLFHCRLLLEYEEYEKAEKEAQRGIDRLPENGDFYKYLGDCWYRKDKEKAYDLYQKAFPLTANGFVLLEIEEKAKEDKEELLAKIKVDRDLINCLGMLIMLPDDLDFTIQKYLLLLDYKDNQEYLFHLLNNVKREVERFEYNQAFVPLLEKIYVMLKEDKQSTELNIAMAFAQKVEDYKLLKQRMEDLCKKEPENGTLIKIFGDVNYNLGLRKDAEALYRQSTQKECSQFTKAELARRENHE